MSLAITIKEAYQQVVGFNAPNPMQRQVWTYMQNNQEWGIGLLLKAPTGSGKTEAVSIPALVNLEGLRRRLIMVYPTRSLVDDQIGRFKQMLSNWSKEQHQVLTLVIDTGARSLRYQWQNGKPLKKPVNMRRHLYQGDVIVTTLDKFLYRFFGFGEPNKSYIYPLRIHYGTQKTLVCFDEAHVYDDVAFTNFARLVRTMYEKGLDVALMTATMPQTLQDEFKYLEVIDFTTDENHQALAEFTRQQFPERHYPQKRLTYFSTSIAEPEIDQVEEDSYFWVETEPLLNLSPTMGKIIELAQDRYSSNSSRRLIITVERVKDAVKVYETLLETLPDANVLLYHGRLTNEQRSEVYQQVLTADKQNGSYLLVSTSAIEVGCDLNSHILITQLCDPERLIQRAGRCNRKQDISDAEVIVVGDTIPVWLTSLDPNGLAHYQTVLQAQDRQLMDVETLINCINKTFAIDYRTELMFDMLYEYVYEAKLENKPLHEKGLLFTRSWEPTITLCTGEDDKGHLLNAIEVPVSRCVAKKGEMIDTKWLLHKRTFNWRDRKPEWSLVGSWECAYAIDVVAMLDSLYSIDEKTGYIDLPKLFNYSYRSGYRRVLVREEDNFPTRIWYLDKLSGNIQSMLADHPSTEDEIEEDNTEANP